MQESSDHLSFGQAQRRCLNNMLGTLGGAHPFKNSHSDTGGGDSKRVCEGEGVIGWAHCFVRGGINQAFRLQVL